MASLSDKFAVLKRKKGFKYGLPFLIMMVAGSFGLQQFTQLRYKFSKKQPINPDEMKKVGIDMKEPTDVTLETEYEKVKQLDISHWSNIRGPRPWEEEENKA